MATTVTLWVAAGVSIITIVLWASAILPEYLVAMLFFAAAMILRVAPDTVVFAGFLSSAFWLVLSGFVLGIAIRKVGLADRVAGVLASRLSGSWARMVGGVVLLTYALAFVMPSNMGRIALLMPIVMHSPTAPASQQGTVAARVWRWPSASARSSSPAASCRRMCRTSSWQARLSAPSLSNSPICRIWRCTRRCSASSRASP
jgi:di/tricarboxylate transporter